MTEIQIAAMYITLMEHIPQSYHLFVELYLKMTDCECLMTWARLNEITRPVMVVSPVCRN